MSSYSIATGTLNLHHRDSPDTNVSALVDVRLVLERLGAEQTSNGQWVNVLGYVTSISPTSSNRGEPMVRVQALLLWSAGPVDVQQYQASVQTLQQQ